jgi:uncharacterized protein YhaN
MRIERFAIDGFGIFRGFRREGLDVGTPIFLGANEAGKSTLMAFLQRMLFGWKDKKKHPNPYEPLCGGSCGGELTLVAAAGKRIRITRSGSGLKNLSLVLDDGRRGTEADLAALYGRVNERVYRSVYAFGLDELQGMETLDEAGIRERIYAAGAGLGGVSLQEVRGALQREAKALFLPSGSKPEINQLLGEIREIDQSLKGIWQQVAAYDRLKNELKETGETQEKLSQDREEAAGGLRSVENLLLARGDWVDLQAARGELEKLPVLENFPEDGLTRLENLLATREELKSGPDELAQAITQGKVQVEAIALDCQLLDTREEITALEKENERYRSAREDRQEKDAARVQLADELRRTLREIGPAWREEELESFDVSIASLERLQAAAGELHRAERDLDRQEDGLNGVVSRLGHTREELEEAKRDYQALIQALGDQGEDRILAHKQALHKIRAGKARQSELEHQHDTNQRTLPQVPTSPLWPAFAFFLFALLMGVLFVVVYPFFWLGVAGFAAFAAMGGIYLLQLRKRSLAKTTTSGDGDLLAQDQAVVGELKRLQAQLLTDAQACSFSDVPDTFQLEEAIQAADTRLRGLQRTDQAREAVEKLQLKLEHDEAEKGAQEERRDQAKERLKRQQAEWQAFMQSLRLEPTLSPEGAQAAFAKAETAREKWRAILQLEADLSRMASAIATYEERVRKALQTCHRAEETGDSLQQVASLVRELAAEQSRERKRDDLLGGIEKDSQQLEQMKRKLADKEEELAALLRMGSATDVEQFRRHQGVWMKKRELVETVRQAEKNLRKLGGEGDEHARFLAAMAEASPQDLQERKQRLENALEQLNGEAQAMAEKKGGLLKSIQELERTEEGETFRSRRMERIDQLSHAVRRWAVLTMADTFLAKAMRKFELERQPEVLKVAQGFFAKLTGGRYSAVIRPMDEEKLYLRDRDGSRKGLGELSTGTAEQLYLALRFGFIREFDRGNEALPIILDDIFVNFDPDRFQAACGTVRELAETHQVLYFTCHPILAEEMASIVSNSCIIELPAAPSGSGL